MLTIKHDINQQNLKTVTSSLSNLNNFHLLEVVDRVIKHDINQQNLKTVNLQFVKSE